MSPSGLPNRLLPEPSCIGKAALPLLLFCALTLALLLGSARAADLSPAETTQLISHLQEHRAKFPSLVADFTEERTSQLLQKPIVSQGTLSFQVPNKFRRELHGSNASTMVCNGQKLWIYYPNLKEAELFVLGQRAFFDNAIEALTAGLNFQQVAEFYRYTASKEAEGYKLVLVPKTGGLKRLLKNLTVWVDDGFKVDKTIAELPKGDHVTTIYHNQRAAPIAPATFEFAPPADAHVSQPLGK